jgi:hypothetical protein
MKIQLGNNLKVFLTTNLNTSGTVLSSGFTTSNTKEIAIVSGSLSASQNKNYEYIEKSSLLDSVQQLESRVKASLDTGSIGFNTTFNTSSKGPFDAWLWNALVNQANYPAAVWNITSTSHTMDLVRTENTTYSIGILVFSDNLVYVFDDVKIGSLSLSLDISALLISSWSCNFKTYRVLDNVTLETVLAENKYVLSNGLTGAAEKIVLESYTWGIGKLLKVNVGKQSEEYTGTLASLGIELNIANNQAYIPNNSIDRQKLSQNYVNAGTFALDGSIRTYTRSSGSYSHDLIKEIGLYRDDPYYVNTYNILLEVMSGDTTKLCDIQLKSCNLQATTEFSTTLTDTINFKVVEGPEAQDCFIKFYT